MQIPLQITMRNMARSDALEASIRAKVAGLEQFHARITSCRVTVGESDRHHRQGRGYEVCVDIRVPARNEIVVTRQHHQDVYVALRDAFDAATRQLEDAVREVRGDVKSHAVTRSGTVTRLMLDEGYGFVETGDGRELYFSRENVVHPPFEHLKPGMAVQFIEASGDDGPQANRISGRKHRMALG